MAELDVSDPFALMERQAVRQNAEAKLLERIQTAKKRLVVGKSADAAFFACIALRMKHKVSWDIPTAGTDGRDLWVNPVFFESLTEAERVAVIAHEVLHCASKHHTRQGKREKVLWNIAGDLVINPILRSAGFKLPKGALYPGEDKFHDIPGDLSTEETYQKLFEKQQKDKDKGDGDGGGGGGAGGSLPQRKKQDDDGDPDGDQDGEGEGEGEGQGEGEGGGANGYPASDPGGCGTVKPAGATQAELSQAEAEQDVQTAQARNAAKTRGTLSAGLSRYIDTVLEAKVDWRGILRDFVGKRAKNDYSFLPPNRRYLHMGLALPGMQNEELGDVVILADMSGSIWGDVRITQQFFGEIEAIGNLYPACSITIVYHDVPVKHVQNWCAEDGPLERQPRGGGGTSHKPAFEWIAQQPNVPTCVVCLTDLESVFPAVEPTGFPVLWVTTEKGTKGPFGQTVELNINE